MCLFCFFFFKQKTAYDMRISYWSSDVCSSDLFGRAIFLEETGGEAQQVALHRLADVGDGALAEPADEIEAQRGREGERDADGVEKPEMRCDIAAAGDEDAVDQFLELIGDRERVERGHTERDRRHTQSKQIEEGDVSDHDEHAHQ